MRISGGSAKGRKVILKKAFAQKSDADELRPTSGKVREAIFNILGPRIVDSRFLDLFAGTGAVGLEALSRGASGAVFVDISSHRVKLIRDLATKFGLGSERSLYNPMHSPFSAATRCSLTSSSSIRPIRQETLPLSCRFWTATTF